MEKQAIERSIWIAATRERTWSAITEPEQLAQWLLPPMLGAQMKRDDSGKLYVCMGPMEIAVATLEASDPPRQMSMRGLPDALLTITYRLSDENSGTRVTVVMSGFDSLPEDARQDRFDPSGMGWEKALENLKAYLAGKELPFPQGYVAALFGYRREAKQKFAVERSIWIKATRERVWHSIADPVQLEKWFSPGTAWQLSALEVGGRYFVRDAATGAGTFTQVIELLDPPQQMVTRSQAEPPETVHRTSYTLVEENGGTRITIAHSGYELEPDDMRWGNMEQNAFGFGMMLENLKAQVEGEQLPNPAGF